MLPRAAAANIYAVTVTVNGAAIDATANAATLEGTPMLPGANGSYSVELDGLVNPRAAQFVFTSGAYAGQSYALDFGAGSDARLQLSAVNNAPTGPAPTDTWVSMSGSAQASVGATKNDYSIVSNTAEAYTPKGLAYLLYHAVGEGKSFGAINVSNDLDMGAYAWSPVDLGVPFDGMGHTISNLYVSGDSPAGLFLTIGSTGSVKNLGIRGYFRGSTGGSLANACAGSIVNVWSDAEVEDSQGLQNMAGLVYDLTGGSMTNACYFGQGAQSLTKQGGTGSGCYFRDGGGVWSRSDGTSMAGAAAVVAALEDYVLDNQGGGTLEHWQQPGTINGPSLRARGSSLGTFSVTVRKDNTPFYLATGTNLYAKATDSSGTLELTRDEYNTGVYKAQLQGKRYYLYMGADAASAERIAGVTLTPVTPLTYVDYYTVTLTPGGGVATVSGGGVYLKGSTVAISATLEPDRVFRDWTYPNGTVFGTAASASISGLAATTSLTATAVWGQYTISYDLGGGTGSAENPASYTKGDMDITLRAPTREGYAFLGWTGTGLTEVTRIVTIPTGSTGNRSYTAVWEQFSITYDLDGGTASPENPATYTRESAAITLTDPAKQNFTFAGWTGTGIAGTAPALSVVIPTGSTGDRSYTAHWLSADASLASLTATTGNVEGPLPSDDAQYAAIYRSTVGCNVLSTSLTAVPTEGGTAQVSTGGSALAALDNLPLQLGQNQYDIVVTAADGVTTARYKLIVTRGDYAFSADSGGTFVRRTATGLTFRCTGAKTRLTGVKVNGIAVPVRRYAATESQSGSTVLTLSAEYLETLPNGNYVLTLEYGNEIAVFGSQPQTEKFAVSDTGVSPSTGETGLWWPLPVLAASGLTLWLLRRKRSGAHSK